MIDCHSHIHISELGDTEACSGELERARRNGVCGIVLAAVQPRDWPDLLQVLRRETPVWTLGSLGLHPWACGTHTGGIEELRQTLERTITENADCIAAIGETGLDRHRRYRAASAQQELFFEAQVQVAKRLGLPLVLHCVAASGRLLQLLEEWGPPPSMIHGWRGSPEMATRFVGLGHYLSIGGYVRSSSTGPLEAMIAGIPADRLLWETDGPQPTRPGAQPGEIQGHELTEVATAIARIRGEALPDMIEQTTANLRRLLGRPLPGES